jgi:hypothetical protein
MVLLKLKMLMLHLGYVDFFRKERGWMDIFQGRKGKKGVR